MTYTIYYPLALNVPAALGDGGRVSIGPSFEGRIVFLKRARVGFRLVLRHTHPTRK